MRMESAVVTRDLKDEQIGAFDADFVDEEMFASICRCIDRDFPDGRFTFADVGGGNGEFADRLLTAYPASEGIVLDNAAQLIKANTWNPRKRTLIGNAAHLETVFGDERFDVVFLNYALHHFIADDYRSSRRIQRRTIAAAARILTPRGNVSILENMCTGRVIGNLPGRLIYDLTSNGYLAPIVKRLGSNTAGTGICFNDRASWIADLTAAGLVLRHSAAISWANHLSPLKRTLLLIRDLRGGHLWAGRAGRTGNV